jgi:titin
VNATPATVPSVPRWLHGVAGNHTATLLWNPSLSNGGAHIDSYVVTDLHGHGCTTSGLTCTVTGLTNGTTYIFYVTAHNVMGSSANSNSNIVIPLTTPTAPTISAWHPGNHQIILTVTAPTDNGGKTYYYEYSVDGGVTWVNATNFTSGNTVTAGLLTNGTVYHVTVRAVNQAGHSAASNSVTATPSTTPLAPVITSFTMGASSTVIHIGALSTNGSAITAIQYSLNGGSTWASVSASASTRSITIAALPLKHTVILVLRAVNANGPSPSSVSVTARRLK